MKTLSLTMIVKNEEKYLERCLRSVEGIVDEIIVIDTGSSDKTKQIAMKCGAKVFDYPWSGSFAHARNFALQKSSGDWNLVLDADEYFSEDFKDPIRNFINTRKGIGRICIVSRYMHEGEVRFSKQLASRLLPKGVFYQGRIHEQVVSDLPHYKTEIEVQHDGYFETDKTDRNLPLLLKELEEDPKNPYFLYHVAINYKNKKDYKTADLYFSQAYHLLTKNEGYAPVLIVDYIYNIMANGNLQTGLTIIKNEQAYLADYPDYHFVTGLFYLDLILKDVASNLDKIDLIERSFLTCLSLGDSKSGDSVLGTGSFLASYNLGVVYEIFGDPVRAKKYYMESAKHHYQPATVRLQLLTE